MSILNTDMEVVQRVKADVLQPCLTVAACEKANIIAKHIRDYYLSTRHRKPKLQEYPPVVVACAQDQRCYIEITRHNVPSKCINERLLKRLEDRLGRYGKVSQFVKKNLIGHCAEPQAANKLLRNEYVKDLDDIYFGNAYRPRTGVVIPPCENCKIVFDKGILMR